MDLNGAEELISEIKKGNMVLLMDDEDRENEGDLILAGEKVTAVTFSPARIRSPSFSRSSSSIKRTIFPFLISEMSSSAPFKSIVIFSVKLFFYLCRY